MAIKETHCQVQLSSHLCDHLFHTDIHSTFRIRHPGRGKVPVKHGDGQGCAGSQSREPHGCAGHGHPWLEVQWGCGGRRQHTFISRSKTSDYRGASKPERSRTPGQGWDGMVCTELLPSPSDTTLTPGAELQPVPRVTP